MCMYVHYIDIFCCSSKTSSSSSKNQNSSKDTSKDTLTSEQTSSDEEIQQDFFGVGEKPVHEDCMGPAIVSIPPPPPDKARNIFAHVDETLKVTPIFKIS